jgi:ABC-type phosphate/phosphonate transport system permease subunit
MKDKGEFKKNIYRGFTKVRLQFFKKKMSFCPKPFFIVGLLHLLSMSMFLTLLSGIDALSAKNIKYGTLDKKQLVF